MLDTRHSRRVKTWCLAERLGIHRVQASRALSHLVAEGVVMSGPADGRLPTFRLPFVVEGRLMQTSTQSAGAFVDSLGVPTREGKASPPPACRARGAATGRSR